MSAYELIELYCELIVARLPIIESQKSCPIDLKEAVCSVIFASPRCADVPELMDIRKHFSAKYGKEFIHSALEVRPDCGVSHMVVEKLSAWAPDAETKIKSLTAIAQEHNVKWDSKTFEEQLKKPHDDLLNGPTAFSSASKTPKELSSVKYSTASAQTDESKVKMPQDDSATRPTAFNTFSGTTTRTNSTVPFTFQSDSRTSERKLQGSEINNSYPREDNASMNRPTWNMEFEDATTAAQAAAESAEKASFAARAAAELASRGHMSRQNSTASNESSTYSKIYERPENLRAFMGKNTADESVSKGSDEIKSSQGIKPEQKHVQKDERVQGISRREAARTSDNDYPTGLRAFHRSSLPSSQGFVNDILDSNRQKDDPEDYSQAQRISFASEVVESSRRNMRHESVVSSQENINVDPINEYPYHYVSDEEKLWNSNIYRHENDEGKTSRMSSFGNNQKRSTAGYSSGVVFDYSLDAEDSSTIFGKKRGTLFDQSQGKEPSTFQSDKVTFSVDLNGSGSIGRNSGSKLHLFTEPQTEEHLRPETMTKGTYPPQPAFDVSDRENTESEDESTFRSNHTYMRKTNEAKEAVRNSGAYDGKNGTVSDADDKFYNRYGADSVPDSLPSLRSDKAPSNLNLSVRTPSFSSSDEEEPQPLRLTKRQPTKRTEAKEKSRMQPIRLDTETSEISNEFINEGGQGINFGRLTVGFKQRSFPRPPYIKSTAVDSSHLSDKQSANFQVADQERYNQQSYPRAYASKSRTSGVSINSHSETAEKLAANCSAEDTYDTDKRHFVPQNAKITDVDVLAQESYYTKSRRKGYKEISSNFQGDDPVGNEHTHYVRRYSGSTSNQQQQSIHISPEVDKKQVKSSRESSSRMAYLDSDASEAKLEPDYITGSRVELSHRTRDEQSQSNNSFSGVTEPLSSTNYDAVTVQGEVSSNKPVKKNPSSPKQTSSILEELSKSQLDATDNGVLKHKGDTKYSISSGESVSRESSLQKASHTHPKLPDYDSLAAYFHSLRTNRR
ncbi:uncharacterized protein LOC109847182 isoform X2 [Asparagus officinalis]|nr:uncharacterized protein LOC109847182 isoform X2 [Asparagus officinalis]